MIMNFLPLGESEVLYFAGNPNKLLSVVSERGKSGETAAQPRIFSAKYESANIFY